MGRGRARGGVVNRRGRGKARVVSPFGREPDCLFYFDFFGFESTLFFVLWVLNPHSEGTGNPYQVLCRYLQQFGAEGCTSERNRCDRKYNF